MLLVVASSGLALMICCATFVINNMILVRSSKVAQLSALADVLASNSTVAVSFGESEAASELLEALKEIETVDHARLIMADGETLASYDRTPQDSEMAMVPAEKHGFEFTEDGYLDISAPVTEEGEQLGTLVIRSNMNEVNEQFRQNVSISALVLVLSLLAAAISSFYLNRRISNPILKLANVAKRISDEADYTLRTDHKSEDEVGSLCVVFNEMLDRIQQSEHDLCEARDQLEIRVEQRTRELSEANDQLKQQMIEREKMNQNIIELSHRAGKAEIATGVLHNVGNVLNSINVSAGVVDETLRNSRVKSLARAASLLNGQPCLAEFFTLDERGQKFPRYLESLADKLTQERDLASTELQSLIENLDHVKTIVSMQQSYAGVSGVQEVTCLKELMKDAELLNASSMVKHKVEVVREYEELPNVLIEKQKVLQVLVNLLKNAKDAMTEGRDEGRRLLVAIKKRFSEEAGGDMLRIEITDNGVGIEQDNLTRIFSHGFTTKRDGHGFGLHACANACKEMGGSLQVHSDGPGLGATFTIELPYREAEVVV